MKEQYTVQKHQPALTLTTHVDSFVGAACAHTYVEMQISPLLRAEAASAPASRHDDFD